MYEDIIEKLNKECEIRNLSPRTSFMYVFHAKKFLEWIENKPLDELDLIDVRNYILERKRNGASPRDLSGSGITGSFPADVKMKRLPCVEIFSVAKSICRN